MAQNPVTPLLSSALGAARSAARGPRRTARPAGGRRVLVTGGASGLGLALAEVFLARGDRVAVADLAPVDGRPDTVPAAARYLQLDVRSEEGWHSALAELEDAWGGLDLLVNNAGIAQGGRIDRLTEADWEAITAVNLLGVARGCRVATPLLRRQGAGQILNIASLAGLVHPPAMSSYAAVKAAVVALSDSLRWELEPHGVTVSVACPGFLRTNLAASLNDSDPAARETAVKLISRSPRGPAEVAEAIVRGADRGRFLVLPDRDARATYAATRATPWVVGSALRAAGRKLARSGPADAASATPATPT